MGTEIMKCCGALTHVYGDAGNRKHNPGCPNLKSRDDLLAEIVRLKYILSNLVELSECRFDHDGGCQEHGFISLRWDEMCPQQQAKDVLGLG